ncbi:putative E3 ubiquitin-protein ligase RZFP34 [Camellia lanceoleosa]|uniref:E3 ubiquitin-protein ligase RZFP34 n=1 Tax=Camellia lanceoleosa TaxID=1840588 RepID=A0ACC0HDD9_9ERIC|nr:putative E3 ubiquitin-protein ligase RZFP34 [Camellia lanceoleosa]
MICMLGSSQMISERIDKNKMGCCYSILLKNSHPFVEGAMHNDCPVCFEYLFESRNDVTVMPCGHTIHESCLKDMHEHYRYACPICSKSVCDMSKGSVPPSHMPIATGLNPFPTYHSFKAARETGALKEAKDKLEKQVEEITWCMQLEKRLRVIVREAFDLILSSAQNLVVPIKSNSRRKSRISSDSQFVN